MEDKGSPKLFYGWVVVFSAMLVMAFSMGIYSNCNGMFIKPICESMGYSRPQIALNITLSSFGQMSFGLLAGRLLRRFGLKWLLRFGAVALPLGVFGLSQARALPVFYALAFFCGFTQACITLIPLSMVITNWFSEKRGLATGIAFMGSGVGGMLFNPLVGVLIPALGWRPTYLVLGTVMAAVLLPLIFFVIKTTPQELGLCRYGETPSAASAANADAAAGEGVTLAEALRLPAFWVFLASAALLSTSACSSLQNTAPYLTDLGYSYAFAGVVASLGMGSLALGKTLLGQIFDKIPRRAACTLACGCLFVSLLGMGMAQYIAGLGVYMLFSGLGAAFGTVAYPILLPALFGRKDYAGIYGLVEFVSTLGVASSPIIMAAVFERLGSYRPGFFLMAALSALVLIGFRYAVAAAPLAKKGAADV